MTFAKINANLFIPVDNGAGRIALRPVGGWFGAVHVWVGAVVEMFFGDKPRSKSTTELNEIDEMTGTESFFFIGNFGD